jgi:CARDB
VSAAEKQAVLVQNLIAGLAVPATLEIQETTVPTEMTIGTTQSFVFKVVNIGSQASAAGTISFTNDDGSLVAQGPTTQDLPALDPGASTTITWQVQAATSTNPN